MRVLRRRYAGSQGGAAFCKSCGVERTLGRGGCVDPQADQRAGGPALQKSDGRAPTVILPIGGHGVFKVNANGVRPRGDRFLMAFWPISRNK